MESREIKCQGQCVACMSENIEGDYGYYPYECQECGKDGKEYYNLVYDLSTARV